MSLNFLIDCHWSGFLVMADSARFTLDKNTCKNNFLCINCGLTCQTVGLNHLLCKLHNQRAIIDLSVDWNVPKSVRKMKGEFSLAIDGSFKESLKLISKSHGDLNWIKPCLAGLWVKWHENEIPITSYSSLPTIHSIEIWDNLQQKIVASEVGGEPISSIRNFKFLSCHWFYFHESYRMAWPFWNRNFTALLFEAITERLR